MSVFRDRQIRFFSLFIVLYIVLIFGLVAWLCQTQIAASKSMYLEHDRAVVSALLEQGISKEVIANAVSSTDTSAAGVEFLNNLGINQNTFSSLLPHFSQFQYHFLFMSLGGCICLTIVLGIGIISFLWIRNTLYQQAEKIIDNYIHGDYSHHLPQDSEGEIFHLFASIEQLATMLQAKNESEHKTKEFLKNTISDISHQLKTPLAALEMYQEIMEGYSFPMLAKKVFYLLCPYFPLRRKSHFAELMQKKNAAISKKITTLPKIHIQFCRTFLLSSFSTSEISFAVAVTIRMPLSLISSSRASSCRRFVSFPAGVSKRNWSTDIL